MTFTQDYPGSLTNLGPFATPLAAHLVGDALAVIAECTIAPGSGRVVVYTDADAFASGGSELFSGNEALFLNNIAYCLSTAGTETSRLGVPLPAQNSPARSLGGPRPRRPQPGEHRGESRISSRR